MAELFVKQASTYAKIRPTYPDSLFKMLASCTPRHELAWDVATGNGQAARQVAEHYKTVIATDISEKQLSFAEPHPKITYSRMTAAPDLQELERVVGPEGSVDLVTVAQAMHWFDLDKFYSVVKHVLRKPGGVLAAWCYGDPRVDAEVDKVCDTLEESLIPYWAPAKGIVEAQYRTIPFPFEPVDDRGVGPHILSMTKEWTLDEYLLLLRSYSAVQTALDQGVNMLNEDVQLAFLKAWGPAEQIRTITIPVALVFGKVA